MAKKHVVRSSLVPCRVCLTATKKCCWHCKRPYCDAHRDRYNHQCGKDRKQRRLKD